VLLIGVAAASPQVISPSSVALADGAPAACTAAPVSQSSGASVHASETLCRYFSDTGQLVDQRQFSVSVSNTADLRDRQVVTVSWSGAHPTGGVISDQQSAAAALQEYPVMLMECRGLDSATVPAAERLSPETCWTATPNERMGVFSGGIPPWSLDIRNSAANQARSVNVPPTAPFGCRLLGVFQYWNPFAAADGTKYEIGPSGCNGDIPPEMNNQTSSQQDLTVVPSDTTYAKTSPDGTGTADFTIETADTNASLGCSATVVCSLVVIPVEGISCSGNPAVPGAPWDECESRGAYRPGELGGANQNPAVAVTASYWWSGSNWQRRISVPLNFAEASNICSLQNTSAPMEIYGSEVMAQATQQWNPHFCLNSKLFNVNHVLAPEPEAKNLLRSGSIEAAIQGEPPPIPLGQKSFFSTPTVQAPVALTGFAISYVIDNGNGQPYTQLKLNPRLLAKLMTESYPGTNNVASGEPAIAKNPLSMFADPEFLALNPGYTKPTFPITPQNAPAATLFSIGTQSDVIWALTSYINSDPEARAWLDGQPDPWGMVVNPAYKKIALPVGSWPLLDTSTNGPDYDPAINPCLGVAPGGQRLPDRQLIDSPGHTLAQVAYNLQYSIAVSQTVCTFNSSAGLWTLIPLGPETLGARFMVGVVSLAAAHEFALDTAALQTYVQPGASSNSTDLSGRVFAAPTNTSLAAAAGLLKPDNALGSWVLPYTDYPANPTAINAYPGTMLLSMDVPTQGLPQADAKDLSEYLSFAAATGQAPGAGSGQLPPGYVPMTSGNGMANEVAYTQSAAADVAAQSGQVPPLIPGSTPPPGAGKAPIGNSNSGSNGGSGGSGGAFATSQQSTTGSTAGPSEGRSNSNSPNEKQSAQAAEASAGTGKAGAGSATGQPVSQVGRTLGFTSGIGALALPLALLLVLAGGAAVTYLWWLRRRPAKT
jgi:hypothetical protein